MTDSEEILLVDRSHDGVAIITLNRPAKLNALSFALVEALHRALEEISADRTCHVVVLTGAGRGFCAGLDLTDTTGSSAAIGTTGPTAALLSQDHIASLAIRIHRLRQPVIAAVNGIAVGGGFALALASDIRVAAPSAVMRSQFIRLGLGGCDIGVSYFLPRLVGASQAATLLLTSRDINAADALSMGLVAGVAYDPVAGAMAIADTLLSYSPFGVAMTKEVFWSNVDAPSPEAAIHLENRTQMLTASGGEFREAVAAFIEGRPPDWSRAQPASEN